MGYSFRLTARVLLYAPSHRQDSTYHGLCYTSRGALAETRNSLMGPLSYNVVGCSYLKADFTGLSRGWWKLRLWASVISLATMLRSTMKDRSDDPPHHERTIDLMCGWVFLPEGWLHRAEQGVVETAAVGLGDLAGHRAEVDKTHISISRHGRHLFISGKKRSTSSSDRENQ